MLNIFKKFANKEKGMPEEKVEQEKKVEETTETKAEETTEKEKPEQEEQTEQAVTENAQITHTEPEGDGIPLSEVALKSEVKQWITDALSAMQAKVDAVEKENTDLKEELSKAKADTEAVRSKYEDNGDFGSQHKKGQGSDGEANGSSLKTRYSDMWNGGQGFIKQ